MPRPRGPIEARLVPASTNLPASDYDRLFSLAREQRVAVAVVIRQAVTAFLNCKTPDRLQSS